MEKIDAKLYLEMLRAGASHLGAQRNQINDLNVFPIPDGDTGDNMFMTINAAADAAGNTLADVSKAASSAMLLGARGNSGVILSRIFAGIAKGLAGVKEADAETFARAMQAGVEEAYHAVSEPVEGTILTVLREGVQAAAGSGSLEEYFNLLVSAMDLSLQHTPELLPVLKKAGVVDSGGAGLLLIVEGMRAALGGEYADEIPGAVSAQAPKADLDAFTEDSVLEFGYCTEFLLRLQRSKVDLDSFDESVIKEWLAANGESLVFFRDGSIIKVHVHTFTPGEILNHCQKYGEFLTLKIENMTLQHHENHMEERFHKKGKPYGVVAVATGAGLTQTFRDMGADEVIEGGQTMNPSADDIIHADIRVIPCKTLGEGYYALANLDTEGGNADEIEACLSAAAGEVVTGLVSRAIRDSGDVKEGEYVGISGKEILCGGSTPEEALKGLASAIDAGSHDVVLIFSGEGAKDAASVQSALQDSFKRSEVILQEGGQPVYEYILVLI